MSVENSNGERLKLTLPKGWRPEGFEPEEHGSVSPNCNEAEKSCPEKMHGAGSAKDRPEAHSRKRQKKEPAPKPSSLLLAFRNIAVVFVGCLLAGWILLIILAELLRGDPLWLFQSDEVAFGCVISLWPLCAVAILIAASSRLTALQNAFFGSAFHAFVLATMIPVVFWGIARNPGWITPRVFFGIGLFSLILVWAIAWSGRDEYLSFLRRQKIIETKGFHPEVTFYAHIKPWQRYLWKALLVVNWSILFVAILGAWFLRENKFIREEMSWGKLIESKYHSSHDLIAYLRASTNPARVKLVVRAAVPLLRKDCYDITKYDAAKFNEIKLKYGSVCCQEFDDCIADYALTSREEHCSKLYFHVYPSGIHSSDVKEHYCRLIDQRWRRMVSACNAQGLYSRMSASEKVDAILAFKQSVDLAEYKEKADALMDDWFGDYAAIVRSNSLEKYLQYAKDRGPYAGDAICRAAACVINSQKKDGAESLSDEIKGLVDVGRKTILKISNTSAKEANFKLSNQEHSYAFLIPAKQTRYFIVEPGTYSDNCNKFMLSGGLNVFKPSSIHEISLSVETIQFPSFKRVRR